MMPEFSLKDTIVTSLSAQEPWPDDVKLFQPYEVEQILLPDNASCLAVQAFLKMCALPFDVEMRWNAEFMSPSGRVPFIKCGAFVVSELEPIVQFAANKGVTLCGKLSTEEKAEMRAYMSLVTNVLVNAELYISWLDNDTYTSVTKVRNSSVYPWPLGWIQTRTKRSAVAKRLKALHWHDKTLAQVLADVEQCCNSLSQRLGDRDYFFGTPTALDALVFGHIRALLSAVGPKAALLIKPITSSLLRHLVRMINLTGMKLTPQEDYLLTQAFYISSRRRSSDISASERGTRIKRSRMSINNSQENLNTNCAKDVFGFRPFASKQIIIMTSKEGTITCEPRGLYKKMIDEDLKVFVHDIIEDILYKVDELALEELQEKFEDKNDFEVLTYPVNARYNDGSHTRYGDALGKVNDYLDTIEEVDLTDTTVSFDGDDMMKSVNDLDSNGSNEKINEVVVTVGDKFDSNAGAIDDNNLKMHDRHVVSPSDSGDRLFTNELNKCDGLRSPDSAMSSDSKSTLKPPNSDEISVENFMKYLRRRNAVYADVDID